MKKIGALLIAVLVVFALTACETDSPDDYKDDNPNKVNDQVPDEGDELLELTLNELAMYDGKDGSDAYIAYQDDIYDVTDVWSNGEHNGMFAGTDVTSSISSSPHGASVFDDLQKVGTLID